MSTPSADRTRLRFLFLAVLWGTTLLFLFLAFRLRAKPLFLLGLADLLLALVVTFLAVNREEKNRNP